MQPINEDPKTYRELLVDTIVIIEDNFQNLLLLGMELVVFEDRRAGLVPFEDGHEIPVYKRTES